jgi:hypothetical protein
MVVEERHEQEIRSRFVCKGKDLWDSRENRIAGWLNDGGYRLVSVLGKRIRVHHIVWWLNTGKWPEEFLDHKDRDRANNSFDNLREANRTQNMYNALHGKNTSGYKNVSWCNTYNKWVVRVTADKKLVFARTYPSLEEATAVAKEVTKQFHGEFART